MLVEHFHLHHAQRVARPGLLHDRQILAAARPGIALTPRRGGIVGDRRADAFVDDAARQRPGRVEDDTPRHRIELRRRGRNVDDYAPVRPPPPPPPPPPP